MARIMAEGRRYDLRVAVRASGHADDRDTSLLSRLAGYARGRPPSTDEIDRAVAEGDAAEFAAGRRSTGLGFTLTRLVAGETNAIAFAELSPVGISVETLVTDDLGVPVQGAADSISWQNVLPALPDDDGLRLYLLAGGSGMAQAIASPVDLAAAAEEAVGPALIRLLRAAAARLGGRPGSWSVAWTDTVLVLRTSRWPLLEIAAARARMAARPAAEIVDLGRSTLAGIAGEAARGAPLRYGYDLILAGVDQRTGAVQIDPRPLFRAGTVIGPHDTPTASAYVTAPDCAADRLALPVVVRRGADPVGWPPVGMATIDGGTTKTTRLQVRLMAPGRVVIRAHSGQLPDDGQMPGWPRLFTELPSQLPGSLPLDLVLLVELGGSDDVVATRMSLVSEVVSRLDRSSVNIAVVGYRDHFDAYLRTTTLTRRKLVVGCGLDEAGQVRAALARSDQWKAVPLRNDYAAPLEDALEWVAQPDWGWRPQARHLLVVVGSRPPHPGAVDHYGEILAPPCPHGLDWRVTLNALRRDHAVECVAVLDGDASIPDEETERAWRALGANGRYRATDTTAASLTMTFGFARNGPEGLLCLAVRAAQAEHVPMEGGR